MDSERTILHVDMDAFFASVEQILDPTLKGKPVIVGGDGTGRSVVSAASYEARRYGIHSAMPTAQARRLCPHGIFVRGTHGAYSDFSHRTYEILERFSPLIERTSLDDFYLDLTGCGRLHGTPIEIAEKIKRTVFEETQLPVSVGVGTSKLVAKVASGLAKPSGILQIFPGSEAGFFRPLPVKKLPGVGKSAAETLHRFNLKTLGDVAAMTPEVLEKTFGSHGPSLWRRAQGIDSSPVTPDHGPRKSISRDTTFSEDTLDAEELRAVLYSLTEYAARQLRSEGMVARTVTVKVRYSDFKTVTAARKVSSPTDMDHCLYEVAVERLDYLLLRRMRVRLIGVSLSNLAPRDTRQGELFDAPTREKQRRLCSGLDRLRNRFGPGIISAGPAVRLQKQRL
jgi:DNA polymerase IV